MLAQSFHVFFVHGRSVTESHHTYLIKKVLLSVVKNVEKQNFLNPANILSFLIELAYAIRGSSNQSRMLLDTSSCCPVSKFFQ